MEYEKDPDKAIERIEAELFVRDWKHSYIQKIIDKISRCDPNTSVEEINSLIGVCFISIALFLHNDFI